MIDSAPLSIPAADAAQSQSTGARELEEKMPSAGGMVQIRPGVAKYDLPRGEEQARIGWGYAARREGPADREKEEGRERGARRG